MTTNEYQMEIDAIQNFLAQTAGRNPTEFTPESVLLESGILDSLGVVQLMTFLSETRNVEIGDEDFTLENFETVGSLARFVAAKRSSVAA